MKKFKAFQSFLGVQQVEWNHLILKLDACIEFEIRVEMLANNYLILMSCMQIYPTSVRSTGIGVANSVGRIGPMISPIVVVHLLRGCHQTAAIACFEAVLALSAVSVMLLSVETKGRELIDTQDV